MLGNSFQLNTPVKPRYMSSKVILVRPGSALLNEIYFMQNYSVKTRKTPYTVYMSSPGRRYITTYRDRLYVE